MGEAYKQTWRALMIDQHFPDAPFVTFESFSAEEEADACANAGVDTLHITTKCHWGYSYYDTDVGVKHPALRGDLVGDLTAACRQRNIEICAYSCFMFESQTARDHPDWRMRLPDGRPMIWRQLHGDRDNYRARRWGMVCVNNPGYRENCLAHIREVARRYPIDGMFLDIVGEGFNWKYACHCEHCRRLYGERGIDPSRDRLGVVDAWCDIWSALVADVRDALESERPGTALSLNGGPLRVPKRVLDQVDWIYTEGGENGYNAVVIRGCGRYPQCGIAGGPAAYDDWPRAQALLQTSTVLAHGSRTFFFFMVGRDPDGRFADHKFAFLEQINRESARKQEHVAGAVPVKCAGLYHSEPSLLAAGATDEANLAARRFGAAVDVFRGLSLPCEVIPNWNCRDEILAPFDLLVVSELPCLSDGEIAAFERFVERGGCLLVCGGSGIRDEHDRPRSHYPLHRLLGLSYGGLCDRYAGNGITGYVRWVDHPYFGHLRPADYQLWNRWPLANAVDARVVAPVVEPVAVETDDNYTGWFPLPPGSPGEWAGVTVRQQGEGWAIYSAAPLTWFVPDPDPKYNVHVDWPAALLRGVAEEHGIDPGIRIRGPKAAVEAVFTEKEGCLIVHLLNRSIAALGDDVLPIPGVVIEVDREIRKVKRARVVYPREEKLRLEAGGERVDISVPPIEIHTIVQVE